ncbi:Acyl transf 3 domain containing protein, partial [Asbolus verrucosus]
FDASAKSVDGLLRFHLFHLGNFEECYNIANITHVGRMVYGKYCLGSISLNSTEIEELFAVNISSSRKLMHKQRGMNRQIEFYFGFCVPSGCTIRDVQKLTSDLIHFSEDFCYSQNTSPELTWGAVVTMYIINLIKSHDDYQFIFRSILLFFLALVIISTLFEIVLFYLKIEIPTNLMTAFSAFSNGKKLLTPVSNPEILLCLNGIKAISMMWWEEDTLNMIIINGTLSVDSFFTIAGLVTVYTFLKACDNGVEFNIFLYYLHRYIRLTPSLAIMVLIHSNLLEHLGNGPLWRGIYNEFVIDCKNYWWSALLYIQNYAHGHGTCVPQSWYLSVDFQLYLLSPMILIPLKKRSTIGLIWIGILIATGIIIPFTITYTYKIPAFMLTFTEDIQTYMWRYYKQTHTRFGPYVIGMLAGPINLILSLPIFQFLSKLSYAMYLVHYLVITLRYASMKTVLYFSNENLMTSFWGDFMVTLIFSVLLCLMFESPMIVLERHIFGIKAHSDNNWF